MGANLEGSASVGIRQLTGIGSAYGAFPKRARVWEADGSFREYEVTPEMAWKTTEETLRRYNGRASAADLYCSTRADGTAPG